MQSGRVRESCWSEPMAVIGAELEAAVEVEGGDGKVRRVGFRVDRVDRVGGHLRLTDYKTGRTLSVAVKPEDSRWRRCPKNNAGTPSAPMIWR